MLLWLMMIPTQDPLMMPIRQFGGGDRHLDGGVAVGWQGDAQCGQVSVSIACCASGNVLKVGLQIVAFKGNQRNQTQTKARPFPANQTMIQQNPPDLQLDYVFWFIGAQLYTWKWTWTDISRDVKCPQHQSWRPYPMLGPYQLGHSINNTFCHIFKILI